MARNVRRRVPQGDYTVVYDGEGTLSFGMDSTLVRREDGSVTVRLKSTEVAECHDTMRPYCGDNGFFLEASGTAVAS
jgi:hypothetical protein